ncbi:hypothetical protein ACTVZO_41385 [Streptomyces sp. IBSNAI002]|uniref:hypothetical protein n=1 Tax=Streptomyces sp. IBSNAI002 TaxID=3457500 RepID=UPI003FD4DD24
MSTTALSTSPGDADTTTVSITLAALTTAATQPFDQWDRARSEQVQELAAWLQCAAMWRSHEEVPGAKEGSSLSVIHGLIAANASLLARQQAEIAPFKRPDGCLLGNDYDDHDEAADRHVDERLQMLGTVMAVLAGEFGRPEASAASEPGVQAGMRSVLGAMTDPDLEGGDIVEAIKHRLHFLGFDLSIPGECEDEDA